MNPLVIPAIIDVAKKIFDRVVPDKAAAEKAKQEFEAVAQSQDFQVQLAQIAVNAEEAKHPSIFVSGWRPAVGWVGVAALACAYIPKAVALTGFWCYQAYLTYAQTGAKLPPLPAFPDLGVGDVLALLAAILGVGWMRTHEKVKGVARNQLKPK